MIKLQEIKDIIDSIFSSNGYTINNLNVQFPQPLDIKIVSKDDKEVSLDFTKSLPKVTWKRFISVTSWVQGISLGQTAGVLKLRYLPDIRFDYESGNKLFGQAFDISDIEQDIEKEFTGEDQKKIARKCLQYANEWATIASQSGLVFSQCSPKAKNQLKKSCKKFVTHNIRNDEEIVAGSVILTFLLLYVVLPVVLKFVLERLFKKLFS